MNDRKDDLLAGAFHDDWNQGPAAVFARNAAKHARRRIAARRTVVALGSVAAVATAILVSLHPRPAPFVSPPPHVAAAPKPAYEIISDDELIAQLRNQPLLVVKKADGTKEITLITEPPAESAGGDSDSPHVE